jgi:hypothetical protein
MPACPTKPLDEVMHYLLVLTWRSRKGPGPCRTKNGYTAIKMARRTLSAGPEAISLHEAAEELSRVTGREVAYHPETLEEAYESRSSNGAPEWEVEGWVTSYAAIAAGEMNVVSGMVGELTGHPPMGLAEFLRRYPESYRHLVRT